MTDLASLSSYQSGSTAPYANYPFVTGGGPPTGPAGGDLAGLYPNPVLAGIVVAGSVGNSTNVGQVTYDSKGRITAATNVPIAFPAPPTSLPPSGPAGGDLTGFYPNPVLNSIVVAGSVGSATQVGQITFDAKGRVTSATNVAIAFPTSLPPSGAAGGVLTGTYPNPSLAANGVVAGTYGNATNVAQVTVDSTGRVSTATNVAISFPPPSGPAGGDLTGTYPNPTLVATGVVAGTYGNATNVAQFTVDSKGRLTSAANVALGSVVVMDNIAAGFQFPTAPQSEGCWYGTNSKAVCGPNSVVIGNGVGGSTICPESICIGYQANANNGGTASSIAIGVRATCGAGNGSTEANISIGYEAYTFGNPTTGATQMAIGRQAQGIFGGLAVGNGSVAIFTSAAFGQGAQCLGFAGGSTALGPSAVVNNVSSAVAVGNAAIVTATNGVAMGVNANVSAPNCVAIGPGCSASVFQSVSLGYQAVCNSGGLAVAIGSNCVAGSNATVVGNGCSGTDLGNTVIGNQSVVAAGRQYDTFVGSALTSSGAGSFSFMLGSNCTSSGTSNITIGRACTNNSGQSAICMGNAATASGNSAIAMSESASATAQSAIAIGFTSICNGVNSTCIGRNTNAGGVTDCICLGTSAAVVSANNALSIGLNAASVSAAWLNFRLNNADRQIEAFTKLYQTFATAAGDTVLDYVGANSSKRTYFTGATTQNVIVPVALGGILGYEIKIVNNSTGAVSVWADAAKTSLITTLAAAVPGVSRGGWGFFTIIGTAANTAANWSAELGTTML